MNIETFLPLSTEEIAQIVRASGPKVCVFPMNGTRRWFILEHPEIQEEPGMARYLDIVEKRQLDLCRLFFDHGIDTLLTPLFGLDLLERGEDYVQAIAVEGLTRLATHPDYLAFYRACDVRVRFYGDYRKYMAGTSYSHLPDLFDEVAIVTASHRRCRLFLGVFAQDATETVAELAVKYYLEHQSIPDKNTLITLYYGEYVPPVSLFIGFDKFSAFDMPLISTGSEDLYFTVAPSFYVTKSQLREILYDHLYLRPEPETDYADMSSEALTLMHRFYRANLGRTLGVGKRNIGGFWYPSPEVILPSDVGYD
ncbi:MAG: diterpene synthase [Anaerolineae bacterium]|nr:diterpene synthase [Anaerolineae bacterium]